jgi:DNA-binding response OmpR family regulator
MAETVPKACQEGVHPARFPADVKKVFRSRLGAGALATVGSVCAHVLIAEDNVMQAEVLRRYLEHDGHVTTFARDGYEAIDAARQGKPDLVVLDVMMPGVDGIGVCRVLRRESSVLILMLTARTQERDLLLGLEVGADDYMTKPYSARELTARVRTLLRRASRQGPDPEQVLTVGALSVCPGRREVRIRGDDVVCTPVEFEILAALAAAPGRVFTRQQLLERTTGFERYTTPRTIDVHVSNLRRKIERDPSRPAYLVTVFGVGYKLASEPEPASGAADGRGR